MIYSKQGSTVRLERIHGRRTLIALSERGTAEEEGRLFRCTSSSEGAVPEIGTGAVMAIESAIEQATVPAERVTIVAGVSHHQFGENRWSESHVRLHASLALDGRRMTIELGGREWSPECTAIVQRMSEALRRCDGRIAKGPLRLAPHVAAQLWPAILLAMLETPIRVPIELRQSTHPEFSVDGYGKPIQPAVLFDRTATPPEQWPNWYRPSYRSRPARAAFHLRATLPRYDGECAREAVALLTPFTVRGERIRGRALCSDGAIASIDAALSDLRSLDGTELWVPVSAGSWGTPTAVV